MSSGSCRYVVYVLTASGESITPALAVKVVDDDVVSGGHEQDADGCALTVVGFAELVVDNVDVDVQLADVFGFGLPDFEFEDHESA
ncbi:hypothetical protein R3Q16_33480 [Rhodococcus globerulus]|uniref:Uncharacterized protein n=1 Tax=Rhodococcus globerulus TaxID=33008 RepID=A0ABU4C4U3_RHOGO|nr:hypothetical protein [Rhodococcus globerulus]MDV6271517.1 hypothetical protein [Rhodococcus globerulus]